MYDYLDENYYMQEIAMEDSMIAEDQYCDRPEAIRKYTVPSRTETGDIENFVVYALDLDDAMRFLETKLNVKPLYRDIAWMAEAYFREDANHTMEDYAYFEKVRATEDYQTTNYDVYQEFDEFLQENPDYEDDVMEFACTDMVAFMYEKLTKKTEEK